MPNWCGNTLVLRHEDPAMIKRAENAFAEGRFCEEFAPCPQELKDTQSPNRNGSADQLIEKYGYADWYSFNVNEWGTKWDFGHPEGINDVQENEIVLYFDSAWAPPVALMAKLEEMGFEVDLMYYEPGMAFCGHYVDGNDDYYELGGMSADQVEITIPSDLNESFCISENMREYEQENEDES
jgi:Ferredoxin-like domain in Api92-like protein